MIRLGCSGLHPAGETHRTPSRDARDRHAPRATLRDVNGHVRRVAALVLGLGLFQCGGSTDSGTGGSAGSGGSGGAAASGGSGGTGGSAATGGSGGIDFVSCSVNSDCVLRPKSCCGSCGAATREDAIAINVKTASDYSTMVCENGGCPACYMPQDPTLLAACRGGTCEVVDLLMHASSECQTEADCRVRTTDCCECGGAMDPEHLVAISTQGDAAFSQLVCDPDASCPECAPQYPPAQLACDNGHCKLLGPGG